VDNGSANTANSLSFGPTRWLSLAIAAVAASAAIAAVITDDRAGRLLLAVAATVLALIAASDFVFSPRLVADSAGLTIRTPSQRTRLAWAEIDVIRVDTRTHLGLASAALEIDSGELLVVLSKRSLGRDPGAVYDEIMQRSGR
jgi:hypothetical protein